MSSQLKKAAKESLSGRWGFAILMFVLVFHHPERSDVHRTRS